LRGSRNRAISQSVSMFDDMQLPFGEFWGIIDGSVIRFCDSRGYRSIMSRLDDL
jgi:hypothetical protein